MSRTHIVDQKIVHIGQPYQAQYDNIRRLTSFSIQDAGDSTIVDTISTIKRLSPTTVRRLFQRRGWQFQGKVAHAPTSLIKANTPTLLSATCEVQMEHVDQTITQQPQETQSRDQVVLLGQITFAYYPRGSKGRGSVRVYIPADLAAAAGNPVTFDANLVKDELILSSVGLRSSKPYQPRIVQFTESLGLQRISACEIDAEVRKTISGQLYLYTPIPLPRPKPPQVSSTVITADGVETPSEVFYPSTDGFMAGVERDIADDLKNSASGEVVQSAIESTSDQSDHSGSDHDTVGFIAAVQRVESLARMLGLELDIIDGHIIGTQSISRMVVETRTFSTTGVITKIV